MAAPPDLSHVVATFETLPHCHAIGMRLVEVAPGYAHMMIPYDKRLIGNPNTGVIHGGVISALLDTLCAMAVMTRVPPHTPMATLDLRIDYLRPSTPEVDIYAVAKCDRVTEHVAFVSGYARHFGNIEIVASATGTFMLGGSSANADRMAAIAAGQR